MKKNYNIKKVLQTCSLLLLVIIGTNVSAQVGIGTTTPSAALEINSPNEGLLIPRVSLNGINDITTVLTRTPSELVYNNNTINGANGVSPGYYYLNETANGWIRLATGANATPGWSLAGNTSIDPNTNFLGTRDGQPLIIKTDNTERMRVISTGNVGIGSTLPSEKLEISNGNIFLNGTARHFIKWAGAGTGSPTFGTSSTGTKLVLYPSAATLPTPMADYAIGIENGAIWYGVPLDNVNNSHKFYAGTSPLMTIRGDGNVGIRTTAPAAALDITSTNDGILIPRISLASTTSVAVNNPTASKLVYNTNTVPGANGVSPGFYYLNPTATAWIKLATATEATANWGLTGNAGTTGSNFLGTTDAQDLSIRTAGQDRIRVASGGNVGIGTSTPQKQLHVNGSLQVTGEINVGTPGTPGTAGQYLKSNGAGMPPTWENLASVVPGANGTVIAVNGQFVVAQELTVQMSADFTLTPPLFNIATPIRNLSIEIIDNEDRYRGTATENSFTVSATGVYQVILNMQISQDISENPVIGIYDNGAANWIARINDRHVALDMSSANGRLQTQTLITSVNMVAGRTYSFRIASAVACTIRAVSSGSTGGGPVSQITVKRLR